MSVIHQEVTIPASPDRVYAALTTSKLFTDVTGGRAAEIASAEGAPFSLFGGMIHGRNLELVPAVRLVQAWRAKNWDLGVYSVVRFSLVADGSGTKLVLDHTGFPPEQQGHLSSGWAANYWEPLTKYFS